MPCVAPTIEPMVSRRCSTAALKSSRICREDSVNPSRRRIVRSPSDSFARPWASAWTTPVCCAAFLARSSSMRRCVSRCDASKRRCASRASWRCSAASVSAISLSFAALPSSCKASRICPISSVGRAAEDCAAFSVGGKARRADEQDADDFAVDEDRLVDREMRPVENLGFAAVGLAVLEHAVVDRARRQAWCR